MRRALASIDLRTLLTDGRLRREQALRQHPGAPRQVPGFVSSRSWAVLLPNSAFEVRMTTPATLTPAATTRIGIWIGYGLGVLALPGCVAIAMQMGAERWLTENCRTSPGRGEQIIPANHPTVLPKMQIRM